MIMTTSGSDDPDAYSESKSGQCFFYSFSFTTINDNSIKNNITMTKQLNKEVVTSNRL